MRYVLLNKPFEVLTQFTDENGRATLKDFVPIPKIYPVGRLDYDSEGLVLLTDDKPLQSRLSEPRFKVPKTYWVQVEGMPTEEALATLRRGVDIKTSFTAPAEVELLPEPPAIWERAKPIRFRANIPTSWIAAHDFAGHQSAGAQDDGGCRLSDSAPSSGKNRALGNRKFGPRTMAGANRARSGEAESRFLRHQNARRASAHSQRTRRLKSRHPVRRRVPSPKAHPNASLSHPPVPSLAVALHRLGKQLKEIMPGPSAAPKPPAPDETALASARRGSIGAGQYSSFFPRLAVHSFH